MKNKSFLRNSMWVFVLLGMLSLSSVLKAVEPLDGYPGRGD